jgi:L-seryl-tRNA(Ser) seleniumtransferase
VVLHTNLGRAPLSAPALDAVGTAAGYVDVEYDVQDGSRARRGRGALAALQQAAPDAEDVLVVNNGAAALVLATTALAAGREVVVSRGEMVEIGDGFRLPDLIASTGARLREVGTTNRTHLRDYADAVGPDTGCVLKVHPSNFRVEGFTSAVPVAQLAGLGVPVVADVGSGLLAPHPLLPDEPDARTALRAGAAVVTASGDKLLGGPQAGLLLGRAGEVERLRRHPLARGPAGRQAHPGGAGSHLARTPHPDLDGADRRSRRPARAVHTGGRAGRRDGAAQRGGRGRWRRARLALQGWAVALPASWAAPLRAGDPCVVGRVERDRCLLDLRCVARTTTTGWSPPSRGRTRRMSGPDRARG